MLITIISWIITFLILVAIGSLIMKFKTKMKPFNLLLSSKTIYIGSFFSYYIVIFLKLILYDDINYPL